MKVFTPLVFFLLFVFSVDAFSQGMGISEVSITPAASSILELRSTTKGFLVPRMTTIQRDAISFPANSLLIYNSTTNQYNYYNGASWSIISPASDLWSIKGNGGINPVNDFVGTTDAQDFVFRTNNLERMRITSGGLVGIGISVPTLGAKFEVESTTSVAIYGHEIGSNSSNIGVLGDALGGGAGTNIGVYGSGTSTTVNDTSYGVFGYADVLSGGTGVGAGGYIDAFNPSYVVGVSGGATKRAGSTTGTFYGGTFSADTLGTGPLNATGIGVYGNAAGFGDNWAGYFDFGNVYIDNNLGIGAANPAEKLDVQGRIFMLAGAAPTTTADRLYNVSGNLYWNGTQVNSPGGTLPSGTSGQTLRNNGTNWVANSTLFNDGTNVGIGTSAPISKLNVEADGSATEVLRISNDNNATKDSILVFTSAGNVGIGTTSPGMIAGSSKYLSVIGMPSGNPGTTITTSLELQGASNAGNTVTSKIDFIARGTIPSNENVARIAITNSASSTIHGIMGFYTTNNGSAGLTERLRIDDNGNVGIGTTSPSSLLSVGSTSQFQINTSGNIIKLNNVTTSFPAAQGGVSTVLQNDGAGNLSWQSPPSGANAWTRVAPNIYPTTSTDNVGIGTTAPAFNLEVYEVIQSRTSAPMNYTGIQSKNDNGATLGFIVGGSTKPGTFFGQPYAGLSMVTDLNSAVNYPTSIVVGTYTSTPLLLGTNNIERMRISADGNVGIGTTVPDQKLDVRGNLYVQNTSATNSDDIVIKRPGAASGTNIRFTLSERNTNQNLWLYGYDGATFKNFIEFDYPNYKVNFPAGSNNLVIDNANSRIGMGVTSPNSRLDISSTSTAFPYATQVQNTATTSPTNNIGAVYGAATGASGATISKYGGIFESSSGSGTNYGVRGNAVTGSGTNYGVYGTATGTGTNVGGYFTASGGANNFALIVPSGGGNVGIGTTNPAEKLDVSGNIRASSLVSATNQIVTGSSTGNLTLGARMMYGRIAASGAIDGSSGGFTLTKISTGHYRVDFTSAFASPPSVNVTPIGSGSCNNSPPATCGISYSTGCSAGDNINNFSTTGGTGNITNNATGCNGTTTTAANFTAQSVTVPLGGSFNISVQTGGGYPQGFHIWIDFDQDGSFSAAEAYWNSGSAGTGAFVGTITIPSSVQCGIYRMRVRCSWNCVPTTAQGCASTCDTSYGEAEDYSVTVSAASVSVPQIISVSTTNVFIGIQNTSSTLVDRPFHLQINGQ